MSEVRDRLPRYREGHWLVACDVCGGTFYSDQVYKRWDNRIVCIKDWEPRHPQDLVRGRRDNQAVPLPRPEPPDVFDLTNTRLIDLITDAGLSTGLQFCLDAGDRASYDPTVQTAKWLDTSGNGQDFYRGTSGVSDGAEPAFNGLVGGLSASEYFTFDGGDYFLYDTTNETWMENCHKNNATLSFAAWLKVSSTKLAVQTIFSTEAGASGTGFRWNLTSTELLGLQIGNAGANAYAPTGPSTASLAGTWMFAGICLDEAAGLATLMINGTQSNKTGLAYSSPASGASNGTGFKIGARGTATEPLLSGAAVAQAMGWSVSLGATGLQTLYQQTAHRFPG